MVEHQLSLEPTREDRTQRNAFVSKAFDSIADLFDTDLENETTVRLRKKMYSIIQSLVRPGSTVLDINCGTGIDVMYLANLGYRMYGIDISEKMMAAARRKLKPMDKMEIQLIVSSYDRLSPEVVPQSDLVFSNFGGLNCTSDLVSAANAIASVTKPGGYFVGVIMPSFSLWESVSYAIRLKWRESMRRAHPYAIASGFRGTVFPVYYYSPRTAAAAFSSHFVQKKLIGLSIFSPTPQSTRFIQQHPGLSNMLVGLDNIMEEIPLIRSIGDHYIIVLQRTQ